MITYQYFEADELLISRFAGDIAVRDIKSFVGFIQSTYKPLKNLYDVRESELNITIDDLSVLIAERNKFPTHPDHISVFLLGKPRETVLGTLLMTYTKDVYNVHICSSMEKAILILKIAISNQVMEERLNNLSDKY